MPETTEQPIKKPTLSNTQFGMWMRCPRQWEFRYIKGLKLRPAGAMIQGSAYHGALAENFKYKIENKVDMPLADVKDALSTYWEDSKRGKFADRGNQAEEAVEDVDWGDKDPDELKDQAISLVETYHKRVAPNIIPVAVEQKVLRETDNFNLLAFIDLETETELVDHKLHSKSMSQADADRDTQVMTYCLLKQQPNFAFHVAVKKKIPELQIVKVHKTVQELKWWLEAMNQMCQQMKAGVAPPNPTGWWCSEKFCGYWPLCRGGNVGP